VEEKLKDVKMIIENRKSNMNRQYKGKGTKRQTMIRAEI
jgi:hypothetical protein